MKIILSALATIAVIFQVLLARRSGKQKFGRAKWLVGACAIIAVLLIWGNLGSEIKESESKARESAVADSNFNEIKTQNESMSERIQLLLDVNDSLKTKLAEIESNYRKQTELLEPFINRARLKYQGRSDEEALQKLASEISKMQSKLVFLGHTEPVRDSISNLFHTIYVFRSEPATGLRDVQIRIRFDRRFVTITERKSGASVEEQGTRITIDPDSTGFYYITGYLKEGNDINIEVISKEPLKILSSSLSPQ